MSGRLAGVDFALIQTSVLFICKCKLVSLRLDVKRCEACKVLFICKHKLVSIRLADVKKYEVFVYCFLYVNEN